MKRKYLTIVFILALAVIAFIKMPKRAVEMPKDEKTDSTTSIVGATQNASGDFEYKSETEYEMKEATYPGKTSLTAEADAKARLSMETWILARQAEFSEANKEMLDGAEMARLKEQGRKYAQGIEYKKYASPGYVSYVYQIYEDTGGAHPNGYYMTFTFDMSGNKVELVDLFKGDARYLDTLSKISYDYLIKDLPKRFGSASLDEGQLDWVRMGTAPSPEALQFYYLDGDNLVLIFPPYQVAAYAAGTSEVKIPLSALREILK